MPQEHVSFAISPGKKNPSAGAYAGLAALRVSQPGSYRISLDLPLWIDVVSNGALLTAKDFQGQHDCDAPHKIVEFDLEGAQTFLLQLSSASTDSVQLTITPRPSRTL